MKFDVNYSFSDFYEAQKLNFFSSNQKYLVMATGIFIITVTFMRRFDLPAYLFLLFGVLILFYPFTFLLLNSYLAFKRAVNLHLANEFVVDDNGLKVKNNNEDSTTGWNAFIKQKSNSKVLLLYRTSQLVNIIPKRVLTEEAWGRLIALAQQNIKPKQ